MKPQEMVGRILEQGLQLTGRRNYELFTKWMGLKKTPKRR
jgi:predicted chitinase